MDIINNSPFEFAAIPNFDKDGREVITNIVKGTFKILNRRALEIAEKQTPITMADEYWGEPGVTPVKYESDLAVFKPSTDLILLGYAYHYGGKEISKMDVRFGTEKTNKTATVTGSKKADKLPLYFLEDFKHKKGIFKSRLGTGFGFYPKQYKPRAKFAGTYDSQWETERSPFLPEDFDYRFFQGAYPELITQAYLKGNEKIVAQNVSLAGPIEFDLPDVRLRVTTIFEKKRIKEDVKLDTVILEPEEYRVVLVWRQMIPCLNLTTAVRGFEINIVQGYV